jgi:mannose-6-phosphate isomerase-like protein (cupin superfamily)
MKVARHAKEPEVEGMSLEEIAAKYIVRFVDRKPDWSAFSDALIDGYRRAQHRFIGNTSHKAGGPTFIPAKHFTLSIMYVPPGQGNASHTHEVEEVFFVLEGIVTVFFEDETGRRIDVKLGPWDCVSCPAGVIHGYQNDGLEPVYLQVMAGTAKPEFMGYADPELFARRDAHVKLDEHRS